MTDKILPKYPVYVPSKGRYEACFTARFLTEDGVPFYLVVEPQEEEEYRTRYPEATILVLPWRGEDAIRLAYTQSLGIENGGLIAVRNWIKAHSIELGVERHWQLDDNIRCLKRRWQGKRIPCSAGVALRAVEDFTDRYENIALSGLNYEMFTINGMKLPPYYLNVHVYSCTLVNNAIPHKWRLAYNDDTDICLQVLADGWCTVLFNAFLAFKIRTMRLKGGNTDELYQDDGRLLMARSLERLWPGVVTTRRRYNRPQHVIADAWKRFDTPLKRRADVDFSTLTSHEYGMQLNQVRPIKSADVARMLEEYGNE